MFHNETQDTFHSHLKFACIESGHAMGSIMNWTQLEPGTLVAERRSVDLGPIILRGRRTQVAFQGDGTITEGNALFGFTSGRRCVTRWNGVDVTGDDVATTRGRVDVLASAPVTLYAIEVREDALDGIPQVVAETLRHVAREPAVVRSPYARHLRAYVRAVMEPGSGVSVKTIAANVLWFVAAAVGDEGESVEPSRPQSRRIAAVRRCREYIERHIAETVALPDLSAVSGLRPRSLINAFEAVTGTSPMAYLRARRLGHVRSVLETKPPAKTRIIDVAVDWGFSHMGHFAAAYRSMFGETPSETLGRCGHGLTKVSISGLRASGKGA